MGNPGNRHKIVNFIILYSNVCLHLAEIKKIYPNFFFLNIKRANDIENYKATVCNKTAEFDKKWASLKFPGK